MIDYTKNPENYVDRYTPEVARQAGFKAGLIQAFILATDIKKPTKQVKDFLAELEKKINE